MPGFNRTGPEGEGPLTGRGLGICGRVKGSSRSGGLRKPSRELPDTELSFRRGIRRGLDNGVGRGGCRGRGRGRV